MLLAEMQSLGVESEKLIGDIESVMLYGCCLWIRDYYPQYRFGLPRATANRAASQPRAVRL